jgi:hypothetical protein
VFEVSNAKARSQGQHVSRSPLGYLTAAPHGATNSLLSLWFVAGRELKIIDLVTVRWIFERLEGILGSVLAFEKTRKERQALLRTFRGG